MKKAIKISAGVLAALIVLTTVICLCFKIRVFTVGIKSEYVKRVDSIDGFYVAVYTQTLCKHTVDGEPTIEIGNCSDVTEYDWKHEEMDTITVYKRFLFFSKKTEYETYRLQNEDGTRCYGAMYVLRAQNGTIHYYYTRFTRNLNEQYANELIEAENVTFSHGEEEFALTDYCRFSSKIDFTTGENLLRINGKTCRFTKQ